MESQREIKPTDGQRTDGEMRAQDRSIYLSSKKIMTTSLTMKMSRGRREKVTLRYVKHIVSKVYSLIIMNLVMCFLLV